jgi:hypothetical protein
MPAQFVDAFIVGERAADGDFSEHFHPLNFQHLQLDIVTAAQIGVDYLAVSFPRCGEDLNYARRLARDGRRPVC